MLVHVMVHVMLCSLAFQILSGKHAPELNIGALLQTNEDSIAFRVATHIVNKKYTRSPIKLSLTAYPYEVLQYNAVKVATNLCWLLEKGIVGIFGPNSHHSSSFVQAVLDRKEIPHIETYWDVKLSRHNCLLNLHPQPSVIIKGYLDLVLQFKWPRLVIIYEDEEGLARISALQPLCAEHGLLVTMRQLEVDSSGTYRAELSRIRKTGETNFILDCSTEVLKEVLLQMQQVGMITERYNFIITNLDLQTFDLTEFQFSGTNITGFSIIDFNDKQYMKFLKQIRNRLQDPENLLRVTVNTALLVDAVDLFYKSISKLVVDENVIIKSKILFCNTTDNWNSGHTIVNYMKSQTIQGLSGLVKFDAEGFRSDFLLNLLELTPAGLKTIGTWHPKNGVFSWKSVAIVENPHQEEEILFNKTLLVITCLTEPYGMLKQTAAQLIGNDRFEGFGIDLIEELSKMLDFNYTIVIQLDGKNGDYNATTDTWNGLIGEIIAGNADLAIADLTVTSDRESAVDFTLQFMNLGISILYKKPKPVPPSLFMFVSPFSVIVWILLLLAYFVVSLCLFIMGRLSPTEWSNPYPCVQEPQFLINQFSIRNSLWFTVGSLMQQGTEIAPIGISTRTASGVWWFFTLIIVSTYTANLAAFLTVESLVTPFSNLRELAEQTEIKYGAKRGGSTVSFFKDAGNDNVRKKIWNFMSKHNEEMTESNEDGVKKVENENYAFFIESTTLEYTIERHCSLAGVGGLLDDKGYAIAMKKNSPYRNGLSAAILRLQADGKIAALKEKWWKEKRGAGNCRAKDEGAVATPLNLQNVGGVFLVLFVGTVLGFIVSFVEFALRVYAKTKITHHSFKEEFAQEMKFFVRFKENVKANIFSSKEIES